MKIQCYTVIVNICIALNLGGIVMKKVIALVIALIFATSFSVVSLAAASPEGQTKYKVTVISNKGGSNKDNYKIVKNNDGTVTITAIEKGAKFLRWEVKSGKCEIVSGSFSSKKIVIRPLSDVVIKQIFKVKGSGKPGDGSSTSPQTGNIAISLLGLTMLASLGAAALSRKKLVK